MQQKGDVEKLATLLWSLPSNDLLRTDESILRYILLANILFVLQVFSIFLLNILVCYNIALLLCTYSVMQVGRAHVIQFEGCERSFPQC